MEVVKFAIQVVKHIRILEHVLQDALVDFIVMIRMALRWGSIVVIIKQLPTVVVVVVVDHVTHVVHQLLVVTVLPYLVALPHMDQRQ